jgi:hypothetical protein
MKVQNSLKKGSVDSSTGQSLSKKEKRLEKRADHA